MCLTVDHFNLGPAADGLLDTQMGVMLLRPSLAPVAKLEVARRLLAEAGVKQPRDRLVCICGKPLAIASAAVA